MSYQVDFLLPLKLKKKSYYFGLCWKILLGNHCAGYFTFDLFDLLIFIPGVHCYIVLVCPLFVLQKGISSAICDLALQLFSEGINISCRQDGAIPFQYLKTVVEVHSSTVFNWKPVYFPEMGWAYMTMRWELQAKTNTFVLSNLQFSF